MTTLQKNIAKYNSNKERNEAIIGGIALAIFAYMWFSIQELKVNQTMQVFGSSLSWECLLE